MHRAINLNKNISCEYLCSVIQELINSHKDIVSDKVLVLDIRPITNSTDSLLPKLGFIELKE
jgi:hypothetical protein